MGDRSWLVVLDRAHSSYAILLTLNLLALLAVGLYYAGVLGWVLRLFWASVRGCVRWGFRSWERLFAWASWPVFLAIVLGLLVVGRLFVGLVPGVTILCAVAALYMGLTAVLAYVHIDVERYEVARGYKAVHDPLKGQELAVHLVRYGPQVGLFLLAAASVGMIGGFTLLNQGLYESVGESWYRFPQESDQPGYADFLCYALINLLRVVDVLDLADAHHWFRTTFVRQAAWPATTLLVAFKSFFTLVLLQQIFASVRRGRLLAETIADFWSPHEPIHERARNALPQYGPGAVGPLLLSLRQVEALTREQRQQLPPLLAAMGPQAIPTLVFYLGDPHDHVRAVAAGALGQLHARDAVPALAVLAEDPSDIVRQEMVEALGRIAQAAVIKSKRRRFRPRRLRTPDGQSRWLAWRKVPKPAGPPPDPAALTLATLRFALADASAGVRGQAAVALGRLGNPAAAPDLIAILNDTDETVRCHAAAALGALGSATPGTVEALVGMLADGSAEVRAGAAQALGALKKAAAAAVPALVPLLQDREEAVRTAAAGAIAQAGPLDESATDALVEGLASPDNLVRAQTAEALGTIGAAAQETAPALVEVLKDKNDVVRAKAVEALGKIGEAAADQAVPSLVRALRDPDSGVSALAAEALGQMGESAEGAVSGLVRSLGHLSATVRANAAQTLGKLGPAAARTRGALEKACGDDDTGARAEAVRALGLIGPPTAASRKLVLAALDDAAPEVRASALEAVREWDDEDGLAAHAVLSLLEDANDKVKVEATKNLARRGAATTEVLDALSRRLLEDDSDWVQAHAAHALGRFGPAAAPAGPALLRAAQTAEVTVREQAVRALALVQCPEAASAFVAGLTDADPDVRRVASAGWMKAEAIPEEAVPALVEALRDPEVQVRANAANALARLESLPTDAIPLLVACAADPSDGLRMNAAMALERAPAGTADEALRHLLEDPNLRVRLIAAGALLASSPHDERAVAVLVEVLSDSAIRVRKSALEIITTLGDAGTAFVPALRARYGQENDADLRAALGQLIARLEALPSPVDAPA